MLFPILISFAFILTNCHFFKTCNFRYFLLSWGERESNPPYPIRQRLIRPLLLPLSYRPSFTNKVWYSYSFCFHTQFLQVLKQLKTNEKYFLLLFIFHSLLLYNQSNHSFHFLSKTRKVTLPKDKHHKKQEWYAIQICSLSNK